MHQVDFFFIDQKLDNAIQWMVQSVFLTTYTLEVDLSDG